MNNRKLFNDKEELESSMLNYINILRKKNKNLSLNQMKIDPKMNFEDENLKLMLKIIIFQTL